MSPDALAWNDLHDHHHRCVRLGGEAVIPHYDNTKSDALERREYADLVTARRNIERDIARQNGTLEPTSRKVKRFAESWMFFGFLGSFMRDMFGHD